MAGLTLADEEAYLAELIAARSKALRALSYGSGDRTLQRQRIKDLSDEIDKCNQRIKRLTRGGIRVFGGTPVD